MRVLVYTDYVYWRDDEGISGERAFVVFMCALAAHVDRLTLSGRVHDAPGRSHYAVPDDVGFLGLPHYESLTRPHEAALSMIRSLRRFWRALDDVDTVWLLGPYIHALAFALIATVRGRRVVLGVRQDLPRYTRTRHPGKRHLHLAADVLEATWRLLARRAPVVVVGPGLAENYRKATAVLPIAVSLVRDEDLVPPDEAAQRPWDGEVRVLSVGRIEQEKNPLMLADVLAALVAGGGRWRLVIAGDGPLRGALEERLAELGVAEHAELLGYVPIDQGLGDEYRAAHALLHVSWTEGVPQVLFEAFAAGLPVVATAVGGVPGAVGDAALLVEAGDPDAPARDLHRLAADPELRRTLIERGSALVAPKTLDAEVARVADFLAGR